MKKQYSKIDWSKYNFETTTYLGNPNNYSAFDLDTNENYFTAELPDDERTLYSNNGTICVDGRI